jgi:hypothetical protein
MAAGAMTQVTFNGNTYSDDGTAALDMLNGAFRQNVVPMIGDLMTDINAELILGAVAAPTVSHQTPTTGATLTATSGQGGYEIDPAGTLATLNVVLPPSPVDGQVFSLWTSKALTALAVTAPGGASVNGGALLLTANGGAAWRYRSANTTWYRRY